MARGWCKLNVQGLGCKTPPHPTPPHPAPPHPAPPHPAPPLQGYGRDIISAVGAEVDRIEAEIQVRERVRMRPCEMCECGCD